MTGRRRPAKILPLEEDDGSIWAGFWTWTFSANSTGVNILPDATLPAAQRVTVLLPLLRQLARWPRVAARHCATIAVTYRAAGSGILRARTRKPAAAALGRD